MTPGDRSAGICSGRLPADRLRENFADVHPRLSTQQALVESDRCYFCYDAPCVQACPTSIDIPSFIRKIATGNLKGSARDILEQNIFGAMCARVCPTEVLCEGACVRNLQEHKPVAIGALQRFATDGVLDDDVQLFSRMPRSGRSVAVVGGGPAGLSCSHRLAMLGHEVTVFEAREKLGGLNEYGVAAYKVADDIAQREIAHLLKIGGIQTRCGQRLGQDFTLSQLRSRFDAVFLGIGLGGVNALEIETAAVAGVYDAIDTIRAIRQATDLSSLPVGRSIIVIGGGMTAIDIATQMKLLGAEDVTIVYRRGPAEMSASAKEQAWAQTNGVSIKHWARPLRVFTREGRLSEVEFAPTRCDSQGRLVDGIERFTLVADMLFKAIGQTLLPGAIADALEVLDNASGRVTVDAERRTALRGVWAGGDCVAGGADLTVAAVEDGKQAALSIDRMLRGETRG
jgi:glutamate synthase (NADPH/NADH) small chain